MSVHDEVMPKMSDINKLRRKLKKLDLTDENVISLVAKLEAADDGMMDWMQAFKLDKKATIKDQLSYLNKEQKSIDKVSADMKAAILDATNYLKLQEQ